MITYYAVAVTCHRWNTRHVLFTPLKSSDIQFPAKMRQNLWMYSFRERWYKLHPLGYVAKVLVIVNPLDQMDLRTDFSSRYRRRYSQIIQVFNSTSARSLRASASSSNALLLPYTRDEKLSVLMLLYPRSLHSTCIHQSSEMKMQAHQSLLFLQCARITALTDEESTRRYSACFEASSRGWLLLRFNVYV